jgi:sigma-54-dependent transcriptional regulator
VPPLRDRPEDVAPLIRHFARRSAERLGLGEVRLDADVLNALTSRRWPGNVRELEHMVERLVALSRGQVIDLETLSLADTRTAEPVRGLKEQVAAFERSLIADALRRTGGNRSAAARELGVSRVTLLDKIARHEL